MSRRMLDRVVMFVLSSALGASAAHAQHAVPVTDSFPPDAVVRALLVDMAAGDWNDAAQYMDLDAVDHARELMVARERRFPTRMHAITADQLIRQDSTTPRPVAEYLAQKYTREFSRPQMGLPRDYADVTNADSLAALPPRAVAARWLEAHDPRYLARLMRAENADRSCVPVGTSQRRELLRHVVGSVIEDSTAFVITRVAPDTAAANRIRAMIAHDSAHRAMLAYLPTVPPPSPPSVIELRRTASGWRVLPQPMGIVADQTMVITSCMRPPATHTAAHTATPSPSGAPSH